MLIQLSIITSEYAEYLKVFSNYSLKNNSLFCKIDLGQLQGEFIILYCKHQEYEIYLFGLRIYFPFCSP